ncbi:MAG: hypothetical protein K0S78_5450 [Thermomicrobiales bacterium]|nr:hypothetical protein [Thermomicrobiales bacterium]
MIAVPVSAIVGVLLGCASWVVAVKLTAERRVSSREEYGLLLLSGACGAGVLALSALRSGGDPTQVVVVALLAIPILITLLTDILARLIFPAVLLPGAGSAHQWSRRGLRHRAPRRRFPLDLVWQRGVTSGQRGNPHCRHNRRDARPRRDAGGALCRGGAGRSRGRATPADSACPPGGCDPIRHVSVRGRPCRAGALARRAVPLG